MTYFRITQPFLAYNLLSWAVPNRLQTAQEITMELVERLKEKPDETYCLIAIEGKVIKAFIAAYKENNSVIGWQARSEVGFKGGKVMSDLLDVWAKSIGVTKVIVRVKNDHIARYYSRRYGFDKSSSNSDYVEMAKAV